jgi:hypothetical protein
MVVSLEVLMAIRFYVTVVSITTPWKLVGDDSFSEVRATSIIKAEFNNEHTSKYEGCSERNAPHFFSETIYSECMKFTQSITGCFLYTCYFSTQSSSKSTALRQRETRACMPSMYQFVSCSRSHVLTVRITFLHFLKPQLSEPSVQRCSYRLHNFHAQHATVCECSPHFLSPPLRIQL